MQPIAQKVDYVLGLNPEGDLFIQCLECKKISYHPGDIENRYCALCKKQHGQYYFEVVPLVLDRARVTVTDGIGVYHGW